MAQAASVTGASGAGSAGVVVVGASAAGMATVETLRRSGYDGPLTLIGDEPHPPYDRPPVSKQLLSGEWEAERLLLRPAEEYTELDVRLRLGVPARALDTGAHRVRLADGTEVPYDSLVVATGARARSLPGTAGVSGVHVLRTVDDALALRTALADRPRLVIVGGGFVGAEAASAARSFDCEVTLITTGEAPLSDVVGPVLADALAEVHREHGVRLVTGTRVTGLLTEDGRVTGVRTDGGPAGGTSVPADVVLVGIGALPNTEWLAGSGLPLGDGVECDSRLYAGHDVWAAGDVASWPDAVSGTRLRIEHRTNAAEQGRAVAANILAGPGAAADFRTVPYVWSDQYGLRLQVFGLARGAGETQVVDGDPAQRKFTAVRVRDGRVVAALGMGMFRQLRTLRELVAERAPWQPESLTC
ncbi:NAD(P)/FAD-dependent oxidoreductase [Streptomyces sp. Tu 6176]|uniref:NAD(P)/FAD-dependent oxidoreductase n=1 Tax=Streptomyces sp. Tu 6176 TaxID=1470557 RepID=UPI0018F88433|nr:FAD-dependent oxidoreductase [Streptomyces sp. Tu 6176]